MTSTDDQTKEEFGRQARAAQRRLSAEIDRVEDGDIAVLIFDEGETTVDVPLALLPEGADAGDSVRVTFTLDREARRGAEDRVAALQKKLEQRGGGSAGQKDFKV